VDNDAPITVSGNVGAIFPYIERTVILVEAAVRHVGSVGADFPPRAAAGGDQAPITATPDALPELPSMPVAALPLERESVRNCSRNRVRSVIERDVRAGVVWVSAGLLGQEDEPKRIRDCGVSPTRRAETISE
jgi:hypothetical protein